MTIRPQPLGLEKFIGYRDRSFCYSPILNLCSQFIGSCQDLRTDTSDRVGKALCKGLLERPA